MLQRQEFKLLELNVNVKKENDSDASLLITQYGSRGALISWKWITAEESSL